MRLHALSLHLQNVPCCMQVSTPPDYTGPVSLSYNGGTQASLAFTIVPQLTVKVTACSFSNATQ